MKQLICWILNKLNLLDKVNLTFYVTLGRGKIKVPTIGKIGYSNLCMRELWMIDLVEKLLPLKDGAFIDIGVNLGQTLIKLKYVEPSIQYFGFEPNPVCVYYTRELIKKNGFKNCEIIPVGISSENGIVTLNCYDSEIDSAATIVENFRPEQKIKYQFFVPVQSFEYAYEKLNLKKISIIKIDVECSELEVIKSLESVLGRDRPFILCEILPVGSKDNTFRKTRQEEVKKILKARNYRICRIEKNESKGLRGLKLIDNFGTHSELSLCDYLFVPDEFFKDVSKELSLK